MKELIPLAIFSTDWHLKKENISQITDLVTQQCELAKKLEVTHLVCLGDVLDSRISQREEILTSFSKILDIIKSYDLLLVLIPGNHDKTIYSSHESFLTPYKTHPALFLIDKMGSVPFKDGSIQLRFLPFFSEEKWLESYKELYEYIGEGDILDDKNILCTHIAVTGSQNNDGEFVSSSISPKLFKGFFKVFSGHYHDQQKIGSNFYHLPSIQQNNFGENSEKGFTVLYSDGSHKLVKSDFREFIKVRVDLDSISLDDLNGLKKKYQRNKDNIRFEFTGSESLLKSLNQEDFTSLGIDVKTKSKEIQDSIEYSESNEVIEHTKESIKREFKIFCEKESLDFNAGVKYLNKKLQ